MVAPSATPPGRRERFATLGMAGTAAQARWGMRGADKYSRLAERRGGKKEFSLTPECEDQPLRIDLSSLT